jgi:hypothetical protein
MSRASHERPVSYTTSGNKVRPANGLNRRRCGAPLRLRVSVPRRARRARARGNNRRSFRNSSSDRRKSRAAANRVRRLRTSNRRPRDIAPRTRPRRGTRVRRLSFCRCTLRSRRCRVDPRAPRTHRKLASFAGAREVPGATKQPAAQARATEPARVSPARPSDSSPGSRGRGERRGRSNERRCAWRHSAPFSAL